MPERLEDLLLLVDLVEFQLEFGFALFEDLVAGEAPVFRKKENGDKSDKQ